MSDDTVDAGGLWARPEAPEHEGAAGRRPEPWPNTEPAVRDTPSAAASGTRVPPPLPVWWVGFAAYAVVLIGISVLIAVVAVAGLVDRGDIDGPALNIGGTFLQDGALFVTAFFFARLGRAPGGLRSLGWIRVQHPWRALGLVLTVFAAFFVVGGIYGQLVGIENGSEETVDALGLRQGTAELVFSAILLTLVAPIVEETVFRGLLFGALWRWKGWVFGAVISGLVFGGIHAGGAAAEALPVLALLGFGLAFLYWYTGSLLPGIGLHALNNAITLAVIVKWDAGPTAALVLGAPILAVSIAWALSSKLPFRWGELVPPRT